MTALLHATRRGRLATALVVLLAAVLGLAGGRTLALWRDSSSVTAAMPVGVAVFGVGAPGGPLTYAAAEAEDVSFTIAAEHVATLRTTGAVAVPVRVDSLAQGHRGLTYTVTPNIGGGLLGASTWTLAKVASAGACTTTTTGGSRSAATSTPWAATYTAATTPTSEYWCLVASWAGVSGTHTDTVTVTGTPDVPGGLPAPTATDSWHATITDDDVAETGATRTLTFDFRTFRPEVGP